MGKSLKNKGLKKNNRKIQPKMIGRGWLDSKWGEEKILHTNDNALKNAVSDSRFNSRWDVFNVIEYIPPTSSTHQWTLIQKYNVGVKDGEIYYQELKEHTELKLDNVSLVAHMNEKNNGRRLLFRFRDVQEHVVLTLPQIAYAGEVKGDLIPDESPLLSRLKSRKESEKYDKLPNVTPELVEDLYKVCKSLIDGFENENLNKLSFSNYIDRIKSVEEKRAMDYKIMLNTFEETHQEYIEGSRSRKWDSNIYDGLVNKLKEYIKEIEHFEKAHRSQQNPVLFQEIKFWDEDTDLSRSGIKDEYLFEKAWDYLKSLREQIQELKFFFASPDRGFYRQFKEGIYTPIIDGFNKVIEKF